MKQEINLEEILSKENLDLSDFDKRHILSAMKQACLETLELCADNADAEYTILDSFDRITGEDIEAYVLKQSILNLKDKIK